MSKKDNNAKCLICRGTQTEIISDNSVQSPHFVNFIGPTGTVLQCKSCGFAFVNPIPLSNVIQSTNDGEKLETSWHFRFTKSAERKSRILNFLPRFHFMNKHYRSLKNRGKLGKRLLDVGCETGVFLEIAKDNGWQVVGLEPSPGTAEYCRQIGLNVLTSSLEEADLPDNSFDVVTLFNVLEHLYAPDEALMEVNRILKEGGLIVIEVPNIDSLSYKIFRKKWRHFVWGHLYYFSPSTLTTLLSRSGFQVVGQCRYIGKVVSLSLLYAYIRHFFFSIPYMAQLEKRGILNKIHFPINTFDGMIICAKKVT